MTGKDYRALSDRLRNLLQGAQAAPLPPGLIHADSYRQGLRVALLRAVDQVAEYCEQDNPQHFDADKFIFNCVREN